MTTKTRRIAPRTYEVKPGVIVQPLYAERNGRPVADGWVVVNDGEYEQDFSTKKAAVEYAIKL